MKSLFILILLFDTAFLCGQVTTFSRSYRDVVNEDTRFNGGARRCVEIDSGTIYFSTAGYSLFVNLGGYSRIAAIDYNGEVLADNFVRDSLRRYEAYCPILKTSDGEIIIFNGRSQIGGSGGQQLYVLKLTPDLQDTTWLYYHHDSLYFDTPRDLIETSEGNFAFIATRNYIGQDDFDAIFLELNSSGQLLHETIIDEGIANTARSIVEASSGKIILNGSTAETFGGAGLKVYTATLNSDRVVESTFLLPQLSEGGMSRFGPDKLVFSGFSNASLAPQAIMTNNTGSIIWNKTYGVSPYSAVNYIGRKTIDGGIVMVGITDFTVNSGFIMKADSLGNLLWKRIYDYGADSDFFLDFIETKDGGLLVSGVLIEEIAPGIFDPNTWLLKLDADGCLNPQDCEVGITDLPLPDVLTIFPNPAAEYLNLKIEQSSGAYSVSLHDATGRLVQHETFSGIGTHTLQVGQLSAGVYICTVRATNGDLMGRERIIIR
jgi:hypothetical protein